MSDDKLKEALLWLSEYKRHGTPAEQDLARTLLAHLDGEPARLAAARREWLRQRDLAFDREEVLRARVAELEERMGVVLHAGPSTALSVSVFDRAKKAEAEREALRARVAELEASKKTLDAVCAVLGREVGNRGDSEGAVDVTERIHERDEAVAVLRRAKRWAESYDGALNLEQYVADMRDIEAVLAKYPEGR